MEEQSLDEVLSDQPSDERVEESPVEEAPEVEAESEDASEPVEEDSTSESKDQPWQLKAVLDEREKRQKAQAEAEELRKRLADLEKPQERPSVLDDEDGFVSSLTKELDMRLLNERMDLSQEFAEREFGKSVVAEKFAAYKDLADKNPELRDRVRNARLPYHEVIAIVDQHEKMQQMENIDEFREKLKAEIRAELEAEAKSGREAGQAKRESITPSLAKSRSRGGNETFVEDTLEDLFGG